MDRRLQAYLDGELRLEALPDELRGEAEKWGDLLKHVQETAPAGAPAGLRGRVLAGIRAEEVARRPKWLDWLLRPRPIPVSPLAATAAVAILLVLVTRPWVPGQPDAGVRRVYVQFVVDAPQAETVSLVGDFSDWQATIPLTDPDGDGVWSGRVALEPGVHEYMFVIDGSEWITDPNASTYNDDGFGQQNAVVAVAPLDGA